MSLAIFDQILTGIQFSYSSFAPIFFILFAVGLILLESSGWALPLGAILMSGVVIVAGAAGYATYGMLGLVALFLALILTVVLFGLFQR